LFLGRFLGLLGAPPVAKSQKKKSLAPPPEYFKIQKGNKKTEDTRNQERAEVKNDLVRYLSIRLIYQETVLFSVLF
jgi:hypothetical protein